MGEGSKPGHWPVLSGKVTGHTEEVCREGEAVIGENAQGFSQARSIWDNWPRGGWRWGRSRREVEVSITWDKLAALGPWSAWG